MKEGIFHQANTATPDWVKLQEEVLWGTKGVRYKIHHVQSDLIHFRRPSYFSLKKDGEIKAATVINQKTFSLNPNGMNSKNSQNGQENIEAFYLGLLAVNPSEQGQGWGLTLVSQVKDYLLSHLESTKKKGLIYAYVEKENDRSLKIFAKTGFSTIGQFRTRLFGRISPRFDPQVSKILPDQFSPWAAALRKQWQNHSLVDFSTLNQPENFYGIYGQDGITPVPMVGTSVLPQFWTITAIPGLSGLAARYLLPYLPWGNRLFNPLSHRFLRLGNIFVREGEEKRFFFLLSSLLHSTRHHSSLLEFDERCPVYQRLLPHGRFGLLDSLNHTEVKVQGFFSGLTEEEKVGFVSQPFFLGPHDL